MAGTQKNMRDALTPVPYLEITADVGKPATIDAPNVYQVAPADRSDEVEEQWQFLGELIGNDNGDVDVKLWPYIAESGVFFGPPATMKIYGPNKIGIVSGNVKDMPGILGCTHLGIQVDGLGAGDILRLIHNHR